MTHPSPQFKSIGSVSELKSILSGSRAKPVLVFKHHPTSPESLEKKVELENTWNIADDLLDVYVIDHTKEAEISLKVSDIAGIKHEFPQIVLFADGVPMYDESGEMISVKKIKLALKIVNRTFKWMETRA